MPQGPKPHGALPRAVYAPIADQAYEAIRESIAQGRFRPGDQLVEARLAEELGISRGPVREGLKRLLQEGLVVHRPHQGMFVRELTAIDVVNMYSVRVALESVAIRILAKRGESPPELDALIDNMATAARANRVRVLIGLGYEFHRTLCELSRNTFVLEFFEKISTQVQIALELDAIEYLRYSNALDYVDAHAELVQAIRDGDEYQAAATLERHVLHGIGFLVTRLAGGDAVADEVKSLLLGPAEIAFPPTT